MVNELAGETSPYLRQHADNPVNWLPWTQQALALARDQNKPILLSIGYSACHWCHVMAHESFENETTATLMNDFFVNIKVDREERPDVDRIYQMAHQLIVQRPGGWPLTMFLSPNDCVPFYGGTYFPNQPRYGMIAFDDLLKRIAEIFTAEPDKVRQQALAIQQALMDIEIRENQNQRGADVGALKTFDDQLLKVHDAEFGGFGQAPKFPQPAILLQALRRAFLRSAEDPVYQAIDFSLQQMALGGIQDHIGGGFYRYSVDDKWMIPHFEKMLYDNGQLLQVYANAFRLTGKTLYRDTVDGIVSWLEREMRAPSGAFYAALDADSEGVEGKFYLWKPNEVEQIIGAESYPAFAWQYGLDQAPNFEGAWHLHSYHDNDQVLRQYDLKAEEYRARQTNIRDQLLAARSTRVRPGLDNKILTSWNALVIRGLASAARVFVRQDFYDIAQRCLQAIKADCWRDQRLMALNTTEDRQLPAYLDDYANLLQAILDCLQYEWNDEHLRFATTLADQLLEYFADPEHGGFFFTASDHEKLIQRPKSWQDEAMPSGSAVAALALHRLGLLTGNRIYSKTADKALQSVADNVNQTPFHAAGFTALLGEINLPPCHVIVRGSPKPLAQWREQILAQLAPDQAAYFISYEAEDLPDEIASKSSDKPICAWICEGFSCRPPVADLDTVLAALQNRSC